MTDWVAGMRCVCVASLPSDPAHAPKRGDVATVAAAFACRGHGTLMLDLVEFPNPETDWNWPGWRAEYFRPLSENRLDQFRQHLAPAPRVTEDA